MSVSQHSPTVWLPRRSAGADAALWASAVLAIVAVLLLVLAARAQPEPSLLLPLFAGLLALLTAAALLVWALGYRGLRYELGADALEVWWLGQRHVVPYTAVDGIYTGQRLVGNATPTVPYWPGLYVGPGRARGIGRLQFFATSRDPSELTLVTVEATGLVLSARDPQGFRAALIQQVQQQGDAPATGSIGHLPADAVPWSALHDRWAVAGLGLALALLLGAVAFLVFYYPRLPDQVPLRFGGEGMAIQMGAPSDLFTLVLGGALILLANGALGFVIHAREPHLARMLWVGAALVQGVVLVAVVRLVQ